MAFSTLPRSSSDTIGWRVEDQLTDRDVAAMHEQFDAIVQDKGSVRLLADVSPMERVEPSAVWEDLRRSVGKLDAVERIAVVGDEDWQRWLTEASERLTPAEAQYYTPDEIEAAWAWLQS